MIQPKDFSDLLSSRGFEFYTGVPDSLLKSFCGFVSMNASPGRHIIAANEGGAVGIAMGYHMATGKVPVVYMQNSGLGNMVNPLLSLADPEVYACPMLLLIGWRGQPGVKDEPQHVKQGRVMLAMLESMEIPFANIGSSFDGASDALQQAEAHFQEKSGPFALLVEKGAFAGYEFEKPDEAFEMSREDAVNVIIDALPESAAVVATTGMTARELYEARTSGGQPCRDFLTVGGMGHASQIALGIALQQGSRPVACIDGDGAAIMHMGSMGIIGDQLPCNLIHILINNGAHGSVGGQPTVGRNLDFPAIAKSCGYPEATRCDSAVTLKDAIDRAVQGRTLSFIEVVVRQGHRGDLGRPKETPVQNKQNFMTHLT